MPDNSKAYGTARAVAPVQESNNAVLPIVTPAEAAIEQPMNNELTGQRGASVRQITLRALPLLTFLVVVFFSIQTRSLSAVQRGGLLLLQVILGAASIGAWVRRPSS